MKNKTSLILYNKDSWKKLRLKLKRGVEIDELNITGRSDEHQMIEEVKKIAKISPHFSVLTLGGCFSTFLLKYLSSTYLEIRTGAGEFNNFRKLEDKQGQFLAEFLKSESKPCEVIKISLHFNKRTDSFLSYKKVLDILKYARSVDLALNFYNNTYKEYSSALEEKEMQLMNKLNCSKLTVKEFSGTKRMKNWRYLIIKMKVQVLNFKLVDIIEHFGTYASLLKVVPKVLLNCGTNDIRYNEGLDFKLMLFRQKVESVVEFNYKDSAYGPFSILDPKMKCVLKSITSLLLRKKTGQFSCRNVITAFEPSIKEFISSLLTF